MVTATQQQQAFQDRINKIREKQGQPPLPSQEQLAAEAAAAIPTPKTSAAPKKQVSPVPSIWENLAYPMSIVGAFFIGMLAVFAARYARFHLLGGSMVGDDADLAMIMDGALAAGVGFIFRSFLSAGSKEFVTAKTIGIFTMICVMHNLVHWAPGAFTILFDQEYVAATIEMTEPNSILFRGVSFVLSEPSTGAAATERVMPSFIELDR